MLGEGGRGGEEGLTPVKGSTFSLPQPVVPWFTAGMIRPSERNLSPVLEGEWVSPGWGGEFSPLICQSDYVITDTYFRTGCQGFFFSQSTQVCAHLS